MFYHEKQVERGRDTDSQRKKKKMYLESQNEDKSIS